MYQEGGRGGSVNNSSWQCCGGEVGGGTSQVVGVGGSSCAIPAATGIVYYGNGSIVISF